jgi:hypothetical protein
MQTLSDIKKISLIYSAILLQLAFMLIPGSVMIDFVLGGKMPLKQWIWIIATFYEFFVLYLIVYREQKTSIGVFEMFFILKVTDCIDFILDGNNPWGGTWLTMNIIIVAIATFMVGDFYLKYYKKWRQEN